MNAGKLLTVGLVGAGAWWLWKRSQTAVTVVPLSPQPVAPVTVVPPPLTPEPPAPPPVTPPGMLSAGYARAQMAGIPAAGYSMDQWNWFLDDRGTLTISSAVGLDPAAIFPGDPNRGGALTWDRYAAIAREHGLSGLFAGRPLLPPWPLMPRQARGIPRRTWNYVPTRRILA